MKCAKAQELFSGYLEKTIQPPMGVAFEQHLAECARCKATYDRFHATAVVLDELPLLEPPPDLHAVIMARVQQARRAAPSRVRWLRLDWHSVFTLRVHAKALAMGAALLLIFVMLVQMTPLHSIVKAYTAGFFLQLYTKDLPDDSGVAPGLLPSGVKTESGAKYADVGDGLMIGVSVDSSNDAGMVYAIRLRARNGQSIPFEVRDSSISLARAGYVTNVVKAGTVVGDRESAVRVVVTQPSSSRKTKVALVVWKSKGRSFSEYVFMPSAFGSVAKGANLSVTDAGVCDLLSRFSSDYGVVILAPGDVVVRSASVAVDASTADEAMSVAMRQAGLSSRSIGPSIYAVR